MTVAVLSSLVAVLGTLSGGLLAALTQARVARAARRETRYDARRVDLLSAVTALVSALADHRRAMWVLGDRRLSGADERAVGDAVAASHVTRSAVTAPLVQVSILAPALAELAQRAKRATFAMRDAADPTVLDALRGEALAASDRLVDATSAVFAHDAVLGGEQR